MQDNKITLTGVVTWLICTLFFMYEFLLRTILGTFQTPLMHDLGLTSIQFSLLSTTIYQIVYGAMQIPVGVIIDRIGIKKTIGTAIVLCTIANMGFAYSHSFTSAMLFRMLAGLGSSCGFICLLMAIYDWMPRKNIALFVGISQFIGTLGPMLAAGPLSSLSLEASLGWRDVFFNLALIGGLITVLAFLCIKDNRQLQGKLIFLSPSSSLTTHLLALMKQKQVWFIAIYSACIFFSIEYLTENEGITFLIKKGFSPQFSSYMITIAWLGYAIACPLIGFFSDKIQRRKPFMVLSALSTFVALIGIIYAPINQELLIISFVLLGIGSAGSIIGFTIMAEQCTEETLAAGLGLNNTMVVLSTALNAPLIGYFLSNQLMGDTHLTHYQKAFTVMFLLVISAVFIVIFCIKETFCKSMRKNTILKPSETRTFLEEPA